MCQWLINVLNIVTGNLDRPGGAMFTLPAFDPVTAPESLAPRGSFARWHSRVRKLPEFGGELPVAALAEEILTEGPGQIKALVTLPATLCFRRRTAASWIGRSPASSSWHRSISTSTKRPGTRTSSCRRRSARARTLRSGVSSAGVRNIAKFSPALFEPNGETRHDWQIFLELQTRMEHGGLGRMKRKIGKRFFGPERLLDLGLRFGPYGDKLNPFSKGLTLRKLKEAVHGIDLGPLQPCLPQRLRTADKRIQLAPDVFVEDIERLRDKERAWERGHPARNSHDSAPVAAPADPESNGHLLLIGRRHLRSNNSWMHNSERMVKGKPRCTMLMHSIDAEQRGLEQGQRVVVRSRAGSIEIAIEICEEIMPGVVSIPHGWGHDREGSQLGVAQVHAGASINDLTDNLAIDALCGTAAFNGTPVTVEGLRG